MSEGAPVRHDSGEACLIPVILRPADWSGTALGRLQALPANGKPVSNWSNRDEAFLSIARGIRQVAQQLGARHGRAVASTPASSPPPQVPAHRAPAPDPVFASESPPPTGPAGGAPGPDPAPGTLEIPEGPVRSDSPFYVRPADEGRCCAELDKPGALIRIKSPKGFGKTSLTARLLGYASGMGYRTVALNLEGTDQRFFEDNDRFMQWFCAAVGKGLGLRVRTEEYWDDIFGANDNSSDYFETYLLKPDPTPLVLAIDNFDRVFAHAAIEDVRQLVALHGLQLSDAELGQLRELVGGHPFLVRKALYELANGLAFETFLREAPTEAGVFADHLRGLLRAVETHPELDEALRQVVGGPEPVRLGSEQAFKLESLGLVVPEGNLQRSRCSLYTRYLADRLED